MIRSTIIIMPLFITLLGCSKYEEFQLIDYKDASISYVEERVYYSIISNSVFPLERYVEIVNSDDKGTVLKTAYYSWDLIYGNWTPEAKTQIDSNSEINFIVKNGIWDFFNKEETEENVKIQYGYNPETSEWNELFKWETFKNEKGIVEYLLGYSWDSLQFSWNNFMRIEMEYNDQNEKIGEMSLVWSDENMDWLFNQKRDITLDENGNQIDVTEYIWDEGVWKGTFQYETDFNEKNKPVNTVVTLGINGAWVNYANLNYYYNSEGHLKENTIGLWDNYSRRWFSVGKYSFNRIYSRKR